jgi:hypothetical protein
MLKPKSVIGTATIRPAGNAIIAPNIPIFNVNAKKVIGRLTSKTFEYDLQKGDRSFLCLVRVNRLPSSTSS